MANKLSINELSSGSPSLMRIVRRISFGITTRPRSSILRTIPVAFIYLSPFVSNVCFFSVRMKQCFIQTEKFGECFVRKNKPYLTPAYFYPLFIFNRNGGSRIIKTAVNRLFVFACHGNNDIRERRCIILFIKHKIQKFCFG